MSYKNLILAVAFCTSMVACSESSDDLSKVDPIDAAAGLSVDEYKEYMLKKKEPIAKVEKQAPPIPKPTDSLTNPPAPKIGNNKTVTLSVTDDVPLKDVFIELARLADIDIEIDPAIDGGVIFKVKDKPLGEVVDRLTSVAKLRYSVTNGVLRIEKDDPYVINYPVNFLNLNRSGSGGVSISSNILSSIEGDTGAVTTGSLSSITSSYDGDLWPAIEGGLAAITGGDEGSFVNVNRQGGQISIRTTQKTHEKVGNYLKQVHDYYSSQVLIEAKVLEVQLNDQFRSGISWDRFDILGGLGIDGITIDTPTASTTAFPAAVATIDFSRDGGNLDAAIELVQVFGTGRTISSPRITALNNQQSVFTFARNEVYFTLEIEVEEEESTDPNIPPKKTITVTSEPKTVPIGIIMSVQPTIDEKNNEIILNLRPTLSRTTGKTTADPGVRLQVASLAAGLSPTDPLRDEILQITSSIPEVEVRELDTILRMRSGQVMAIGGMIEQRSNNIDSGVPFVSEIPILGNAFKSVEKESRAIQTVIFLKASIVPGYGVDSPDQEFYDKFSTDPRQFDF